MKNALLLAVALMIGTVPATYAAANERTATSSETTTVKHIKKGVPMKHERHSKARMHHKVVG